MNNKDKMNILKNIILIKFLTFVFFTTFINNKLYAHELWLEPDYNNKNNYINIMIGQNFNGTPFGFSNSEVKQLFLENKNDLQKINQRDGNFPAIQIDIDANKFNIINYETNYSFLEYDTYDDFEKFIKEQNFSHLIENIDKKKIPTENYKRFSKMLISNSNNFFLQKNNLDYEVVALNSPFDRRNEYFEFRVMEGNKPIKNFQVTIFSKDGDNFYKDYVKTNPNGEGKIRLFENRSYLISAVTVKKASLLEKLKLKSEWISNWASMSFYLNYN